MKKALITGITGQDGSYLTEHLLDMGYQVHGVVRRASSFNRGRIEHLIGDPEIYGRSLFLHYGDMTDSSALNRILEGVGPDEVYNLAAQSHVGISFEMPEYTTDVNAMGVTRLLDALRETGLTRKCRFYQAGTSELFGASPPPQNENTPFRPRSPYAVSKLCAHWMVINYREAYGIHGSNGILFNHESPRRGENFVTRKITLGAAAIKLGLADTLVLGNLDSSRDWGHARDYVKAMHAMLQQREPGDFVVATGETHTIREFLDQAFGYLDLDWHRHVKTDPRHMRPTDVEALRGDPGRAERVLGWRPGTGFTDLVREMIDSDMKYLSATNRRKEKCP